MKLIRVQLRWVNRYNKDEVYTCARIKTEIGEKIDIKGYRTRNQINELYKMLGENPAEPFNIPFTAVVNGESKFC